MKLAIFLPFRRKEVDFFRRRRLFAAILFKGLTTAKENLLHNLTDLKIEQASNHSGVKKDKTNPVEPPTTTQSGFAKKWTFVKESNERTNWFLIRPGEPLPSTYVSREDRRLDGKQRPFFFFFFASLNQLLCAWAISFFSTTDRTVSFPSFFLGTSFFFPLCYLNRPSVRPSGRPSVHPSIRMS